MNRSHDETRKTTEKEVRVPIVEETANVHKVARQSGEVEISKQVDVDVQHISEPVRRTDVVVEERPVAPGQAYHADADAPVLREGETLRVPTYKEELIVEKNAQVSGEAVIRAQQETDQVEQDISLRRERVEVNRLDAVDDDEVEVTDTRRV